MTRSLLVRAPQRSRTSGMTAGIRAGVLLAFLCASLPLDTRADSAFTTERTLEEVPPSSMPGGVSAPVEESHLPLYRAHALAALPVRNVTLAWTRWNPGYQEGAMAAVMVAARKGWFDSYAWILRANPDVRIEDASFLAARLRKPTVDAVLVRCRPRAPSICTDFFAARPEAFNHSAWGRSRKKNGRVNNELSAFHVFRSVIEGGTATVWNVERAYRTGRGRGCRVGGRGIYHDHALCRRPRIGA